MSTTKKATVKAPIKIIQSEPLAYIGPTIIGVVATSTILNNGLPKTLDEAIAKCKPIRGLLVPISELALAMTEVGKEGTAKNNLYKMVIKYAKERGDKNGL